MLFTDGERVGCEAETQYAGGDELGCGILEACEVDEEHGYDEADGAEYTYRREVLHGVEPGLFES